MHALTLHVIEHRRIGFFRGATHPQDQKSVTSCQCSKLFDVAKRALGGISRDPQPDYEVRGVLRFGIKNAFCTFRYSVFIQRRFIAAP
jgi:hypothetical protein